MPTMEATKFGHPAPASTEVPSAAELGSLTLVQIAERLERVTAQIEAERSREREARARYREVADQVEARILAIKTDAHALVREQQRRLSSFDGLLGADQESDSGPTHARRAAPPDSPANISDAIVRLWTLPEYDQPLTTDQIAVALPSVGYESKAAHRSLRSAVNQALAKLCRDGKIQKYRQDGSVIGRNEPNARARKYKTKG